MRDEAMRAEQEARDIPPGAGMVEINGERIAVTSWTMTDGPPIFDQGNTGYSWGNAPVSALQAARMMSRVVPSTYSGTIRGTMSRVDVNRVRSYLFDPPRLNLRE